MGKDWDTLSRGKKKKYAKKTLKKLKLQKTLKYFFNVVSCNPKIWIIFIVIIRLSLINRF